MPRSRRHPGEQGVEDPVHVFVRQRFLGDQQAEVQRSGEDRHREVQVEVGGQLALVPCRLEAGDGLVRLGGDEALVECGRDAAVVLRLADQGLEEGAEGFPRQEVDGAVDLPAQVGDDIAGVGVVEGGLAESAAPVMRPYP